MQGRVPEPQIILWEKPTPSTSQLIQPDIQHSKYWQCCVCSTKKNVDKIQKLDKKIATHSTLSLLNNGVSFSDHLTYKLFMLQNCHMTSESMTCSPMAPYFFYPKAGTGSSSETTLVCYT